MNIGIKEVCIEKVTEEKTAAAVGSGTLPVYASPAMAALIEKTCMRCAAKELEKGMTTVGISLNLRHLSPTPIGMLVRCESELVEIDRRRLKFAVKVYDEADLIGEGIHERFAVDSEAFTAKANAKVKSV